MAIPDMHFGVLFSVYPNSANWQTPLGRFFLRIQKWAFWPLSSLYWITLGYDGIRDLFQRPKDTKIDRFLIPLHWLLLAGGPGTCVRLVACGARLFGHVVSLIADDGVRVHSEPHRHAPPLRASTSSATSSSRSRPAGTSIIPRVLDFYYGGLNSQIEHHLFPRVPHHRYREMRPLVRAFCHKHGLGYQQTSLYRALASVGNHLGHMTADYRSTMKRT